MRRREFLLLLLLLDAVKFTDSVNLECWGLFQLAAFF